MDCLTYALQHGCPVDDDALTAAVHIGNLGCVKLLTARSHTSEPYIHEPEWRWYLHDPGRWIKRPLGPEPMRCLEHIVGTGRPVHRRTLFWAVRNGDVDLVRFLHRRNVPLWTHAWEEEPRRCFLEAVLCVCGGCSFCHGATERVISIPCEPENAEYMWEALRYGWELGAPVTPLMEKVFEAKRRATRAVLSCFHAVSTLSQGEVTPQQKAAWSVMGRVPLELMDKILLHADLEIPESLRHGLPRSQSVRVEAETSLWGRQCTVRLWESSTAGDMSLADAEWVLV
jgi:hypothetical protein